MTGSISLSNHLQQRTHRKMSKYQAGYLYDKDLVMCFIAHYRQNIKYEMKQFVL